MLTGSAIERVKVWQSKSSFWMSDVRSDKKGSVSAICNNPKHTEQMGSAYVRLVEAGSSTALVSGSD